MMYEKLRSPQLDRPEPRHFKHKRLSIPLRHVCILLLSIGMALSHVPLVQAQEAIAWTQTKGPTGGKVNVLLIDSQNPSIVYAGTDGGVFTSRDGGVTWQNSSTGLPGTPLVGVLAINPSNPQILYAGTTNSGIYRSINGGHTWSRSDTGLTRRQVTSLAIDPNAPSVIYAGTDREVFKSADGGDVWEARSAGIPERGIWSLVIDATAPSTLYAGTDSGVYKSTDSGMQWQRSSLGIPEGLPVQVLAIDPQTSSVLYAATEQGVYRSTDAAGSWQAATEGIGKNNVYALAIDPQNPATLYAAAGTEGIWRSTNGANNWEAAGDIPELVSTLTVNPVRSEIIYAGAGRGVYYSSNAGQRWESRNEGLINTYVLHFASAPGYPETLYVTTGLDVHKTADFGEHWQSINKGFVHPNVWSLAVDPAFPDIVYAGTWDSEVYRTTDGGNTWRLVNGSVARNSAVLALLAVRERTVKERSGAQSPAVLYAGTNGAGVFTSTDGGSTWSSLNAGLDDLRVQVLALAATEGGILYAGTSSGLYRMTLATANQTDGPRWQPAPQGLPREEVKALVVDELTPRVVYAAMGTGPGSIYQSTDGGISWASISRGTLLTSINIQALAINPSQRRTSILYIGTDGGIFRTDDGGVNWRIVNDGLPPRADVSALFFDPSHSYMYAGISNSGVYRALDREKSLFTWPVIIAGVAGLIVLAVIVAAALRWYLRSSDRAQEQVFARNWSLWREEIQRTLQNQNEVLAETMTYVPSGLRMRALQQYVQEHSEDNLVLKLNPPIMEPANSLQVWDFTRNWRAAQKRLSSPAAFDPVALRLSEQLCHLLGFTLLESRSYKNLHGFLIRAPALRLKMPPTFPIIFMQRRDLTEQDISDVRDMMGILNVSSYLAVLVVPDDGATPGREQEFKTRFKRIASGAADDFIVMDFNDLYRIFVAKDPEKRFVGIMLAQVDLTVVSPYVTSGPVPENMFFGRDYELKTISRTIKDSNYAIVGGRKIGKTSILTKLHRSFKDSTDIYPLYLDCQAVQDYSDFCDAVETVWKLHLEDSTPESFMRIIAHIAQERAGQLVVILLDEVDALLKHDTTNQERLFKAFRALAQESNCRFIFCGERVLHARLHDPGSAFFNFCNIIRLSYLNPRDTGRIILEPLQEMGIGFEDASQLVQGIVDLSACHPNIVQYICQELIVRINQRGERLITMADLATIGNSSQFSEYLIEVIWGNATPLERLISLLLLDQPGATFAQIGDILRTHDVQVVASSIQEALDAMTLCSILSKEDQEYRFIAPPFSTALSATQDVASLVERIAQQVRDEAALH